MNHFDRTASALVSDVAPALSSPPARPRWLPLFGVFALLFFVASQATGFLVSPPEADMGHLQKILYVHVPAAWNFMLAFFFVFLASIAYLWKREERYDLMAASTAEVGVVLTALALALGSTWGRPTWGVWWTWDPRLTFSAVCLLIYVGYLALRAFTDDEDRRARWSAAVGVVGFLNVPIVYMSVRWWRTLHQPQSTPSTVDSPYILGLRLNAFAFLFLLIFFAAYRYHIAKVERAADALREEQALAGRTSHV
jgi:heme exporter protein C